MLNDAEFGALSDHDLVSREATDRCAFLQLPRADPRAAGTTYRVIGVAIAQLEAWQRWTASGDALTRRGLVPERCLGGTALGAREVEGRVPR